MSENAFFLLLIGLKTLKRQSKGALSDAELIAILLVLGAVMNRLSI
jgi:hypothetical protein